MHSLSGELIVLVARQASKIPLQRYLTSGFMALLLCVYVPPVFPALWMLGVFAAVGWRTRIVLRLPDLAEPDDRKLNRLAAWFWITGATQAAVVGFFPFVPSVVGAVITIYIVGICSATIHSTAGYRRICLPYILLMMGPVALAWALAAPPEASWLERLVFIALTVIYITTLLSHARGSHEVFENSYSIRQQRMQLTQRLRDALAHAEAASQAKTRFLASASHDLRQPIHALSLFSGSLLLRSLDERTEAIARQIDQSVKSLSSQLDALLDISRLDAGVIERSISTVDTAALLQQMVDEFQPQADRKGVRLQWAGSDAPRVRTDPMLLQRIVRNLLSNAIKYTDNGQVTLSAEGVDGRCRIRVSDTGGGIPATEHARIFEEFYQLQNPERDRSKGLGLGLAIVRRLCELLDTEVHLESTPGRGSTFWLDLPLDRQLATAVPEEKAMPQSKFDDIRVLVVDDEEAIRVGMKTLLDEMGFQVGIAASTLAAVDLAQSWAPSILLADFRLRGGDSGLETVRALRLVWPQLPALLISGDTEPDRLREARSAGIELLHKPLDALVLRDAILKAVGAAA